MLETAHSTTHSYYYGNGGENDSLLDANWQKFPTWPSGTRRRGSNERRRVSEVSIISRPDIAHTAGQLSYCF
jgi:hypothetical protein